ncbi:MAG: glycosyltransferase family 9 protein [Chitinispirillaceae bacterium]|nr:glycosyltransferase family 9 protein [Chitinispirillaceae bacterium]
MTTLVYHAGALGDFLTTIPALRYWRSTNKGDELVLLGLPSIGKFAQDIGLIEDILDVNRSVFLPLFSECFTSKTDKFLSRFQTAILFAAPGSPVINNCRQSDIKNLFWQPPFPSSRIHAVDYHLSLFADPASVPVDKKYPAIRPSGRSIAAATEMLPPDISPVALHPGSGSRKKNWPFERWLLLADALRKKGDSIAWLLGPAEEGVKTPAQDIVVSNQPLALCAAALSRCRAFAGSDSGMAHLAAAVACRTVVLFGPSDPVVWAPRGRDVHIIYKQTSCSPCHRSPHAPLSCGNGCMTAITVEEVLDEIRGFKSPVTEGKAGRTSARRKSRSCRQRSR